MNPMGDPSFEMLKALSTSLGKNISVAEQEAKRSREQVDALLYSKGLVDESLQTISGSGAAFQPHAQITIYPTGSLVLPISEQFNRTAPGPDRSLICDQIQTSIQAGVSAFVAATPPEQQGDLAAVRKKLE